MRTRLVKWSCIALLFAAIALWQWIAGYEFPLRLLICSGAAVVAVQAFHSARHGWAMCFVLIALLFNPAIPVLALASRRGFVVIVFATAAFAVSLMKLKSQPLLSIASITDRNPGNESL